MGAPQEVARLVLDTNVLVSALLFRGEASRLIPLWHRGPCRLAVSRDILREYLRVLAYPRFGLTPDEIRALAGEHILPWCDAFSPAGGPPVCRDRDDDKFLHCARAARARALITGDADLLALAPRWRTVRILTVAAALRDL
ncbi:MAG: putative toxin-antitoxin system toxin component, PIN family [bacterium]